MPMTKVLEVIAWQFHSAVVIEPQIIAEHLTACCRLAKLTTAARPRNKIRALIPQQYVLEALLSIQPCRSAWGPASRVPTVYTVHFTECQNNKTRSI